MSSLTGDLNLSLLTPVTLNPVDLKVKPVKIKAKVAPLPILLTIRLDDKIYLAGAILTLVIILAIIIIRKMK
jgi:hypothetical protein